MPRPNYFNDAPILVPEDDRFGINPFTKTLAQSLTNLSQPVGATIAINGPWGSGKSSAVNLIRHHLMPDVEKGVIQVVNFKCWWFRGEEALILAFLQELHTALGDSIGKSGQELIPKLGETLLQAGPVLGQAINIASGGSWGSLFFGLIKFSKSIKFADRFFLKDDNVETLFRKLSEALEKQSKRFLVIIDDIDRLTPDEALLIFRLVKSVGRLPNVIYLLAFDRELAEKAVSDKYPSEGPHFLEKIIQASFDLPLPERDDLNLATLSEIEKLCGSPTDKNNRLRLMNIFYDMIAPSLITPRDLTRLSNSMAVSWPSVANEVNVGDYVALEVIRLFEPKLYNAIRINKDSICGLKSEHGSGESEEEQLEVFLGFISDEKRKDHFKDGLMRLFPRLEKNMGYSSDFQSIWTKQRQICSEKCFDTYFRMSIGENILSKNEINDFIVRCGEIDYVKTVFKKYGKLIRKNGKSRIPLLFEELNAHADKIKEEQFQNLISAIFQIADEIYLDQDKERGFYSIGDSHLRIHWLIRRLTFERSSLEDRSQIFLNACRNAQVGWLVDFTSSAVSDYFPSEGREPSPPEKCLTLKESLSELKELSLKAIQISCGKNELISNPNLTHILFRWKHFAEDNGVAVKHWTDEMIKDDKGIVQLAKAFTGESWSQGLGIAGLADRVSMPSVRAQVDSLESIMDIEVFRRRLEELENSDILGTSDKEAVHVFLEAWRKRESGED